MLNWLFEALYTTKALAKLFQPVAKIILTVVRHRYDPKVQMSQAMDDMSEQWKEEADGMAKALENDDDEALRNYLHDLRGDGLRGDLTESEDGS